jgi:hypothetical protein
MGGVVVPDFVKVPVGDGPVGAGEGLVSAVVLFEAAESDLVALHGGRPDVKELAGDAAGRLVAIADAAEQVYRSVADRLRPDRVELELSVGLSGEVGWFVAKSSASGGLKLKLSWDTVPELAGSSDADGLAPGDGDGGSTAGSSGS